MIQYSYWSNINKKPWLQCEWWASYHSKIFSTYVHILFSFTQHLKTLASQFSMYWGYQSTKRMMYELWVYSSVLWTVKCKVEVLWDILPYQFVSSVDCFWVIYCFHLQDLIVGLTDPEDGGSKLLQNISHSLPIDTVSWPVWFESSSIPMWEPQI